MPLEEEISTDPVSFTYDDVDGDGSGDGSGDGNQATSSYYDGPVEGSGSEGGDGVEKKRKRRRRKRSATENKQGW